MMNDIINILVYAISYLMFNLLLFLFHAFFEKKNHKIHFNDIIVTIVLIVISGARCNFGSDYFEYFKIYNYADFSNITLKQLNIFGGEGYYIIANFIKSLTNYEFAIFWVVAIIIYPLVINYFRKNSSNVSLSILLFLCFDFFTITNNVLKQSLALVALIYAHYYYQNNRKILFYLFSLLAISFHLSSILIIVLMIVAKHLKLTRKVILIFSSISLFIVLFYNQILKIFVKIFPVFFEYSVYIDSNSSMIFKIASITYTFILILFFIFLKKRCYDQKDVEKLNLMFLGIPILVISLNYVVFIRLSYLCIFQLCLLIPKYYPIIYVKSKKILVKPIFFVICLFFILVTITAGNNRYYNYSTFANDTPSEVWYR